MQRIEELVQAIKGSIRSEIKDHSLLSQLNKQLQQTPLDASVVTPFTRAVFVLYDLSNHHTLVRRSGQKRAPVKVEHDDLALSMKLTVFKMLSSLVVFYSQSNSLQLPLPLIRESLEIMILVARLFIDIGQGTQIKSLYQLVSSFYQAANGTSPQSEMLHHLNAIELMRMDVDRGLLDIYQFKKQLEAFFDCVKGVGNSSSYKQMAEYITLEVILKLIKMGHGEKCKIIKCYLPEKLMQMLTQVTNFQNRIMESQLPQMKISPFYELFLSLKDGGQQISEERLRSFISAGQNFKDPRVFDVVALTGCLLPLQIWMQTYINIRQRSQNISNAYKCFIFVTDKFFSASPNQSTELTIRHQQTTTQLESYLKISQLIMLALLLQKKQTQEPVLAVLKRVLKIMANCVIGLYPNTKEMRQFGEKAGLLCSKFALGDLSKSISCIMFYYQILMGTANEDSYSKFYKSNLMQKGSHIFKTIKLAYEIRSGKGVMTSEDAQWIKREPYLAVLFQRQLKDSIILAIIPQEFCNVAEKFQIYFMLTSNLQVEAAQSDLIKLAEHMEETFIRTDLGQISKLDLRYISMITAILLKLLQGKDTYNALTLSKVSIVLLYLVTISHFSQQLNTINNGILLNRYSKLMKLLSLGFQAAKSLPENERNQCVQRYLFLSKSILCWSLEQLKLLQSSSSPSSPPIEPGSLLFNDLLFSFVLSNQKLPQNIEFIRFVRFQIACLTDTVSDNQITLQKNFKLLKLYCSSRWIKKAVKLKILRKLIKEDLISESRQITLQDLNDLILLTDQVKERRMYAEYLLKLFGEQGKLYLMMQSNINPKGYEFLTACDPSDDDDCLF